MKLLCQADRMEITHLPRGRGVDLPGEGRDVSRESGNCIFENSRQMRVKSIYAEAPPCPCGAVSSMLQLYTSEEAPDGFQ